MILPVTPEACNFSTHSQCDNFVRQLLRQLVPLPKFRLSWSPWPELIFGLESLPPCRKTRKEAAPGKLAIQPRMCTQKLGPECVKIKHQLNFLSLFDYWLSCSRTIESRDEFDVEIFALHLISRNSSYQTVTNSQSRMFRQPQIHTSSSSASFPLFHCYWLCMRSKVGALICSRHTRVIPSTLSVALLGYPINRFLL